MTRCGVAGGPKSVPNPHSPHTTAPLKLGLMGNQLSGVSSTKHTTSDADERLAYAASCMQGWRPYMEDFHTAVLRMPNVAFPQHCPHPYVCTFSGIPDDALDSFRDFMTSNENGPHSNTLSLTQSNGSDGVAFRKTSSGHSMITINSLLSVETSESLALGANGLDQRFPAAENSPLSAKSPVADSSAARDDGVDMTVNPTRTSESARTSASTPFPIPKKHKSRLHPTPYIFTAPLFPSNEHHSFFVVSDGHRGNRVSHYLSRRIHWRVASMDEFERKEYGEALRLGFMAVEQELFKAYATVLRGKEPAGSTCCCALVTDDKELFVANVGDSRAVLSCGGVTVPMSFDHKPGLPEERQRISRAGSSVIEGRVQGRLATARAFGDFDFKRNRNLPLEEQAVTAKPEVLRKQLKDDDEFIVIASDGVWDVLTNDSVVTFVRSRIAAGIPLPQISEEMLDYCLAARPSRADVAVSGIGGTDNMTCIMVAFLFGRTWEEYVDQIRARYGQVDSEPVIEIDPSTGLPVSNSPPLKTMRPEDFVAINPRRKTDRIERASTSGNPFCCYAEEDEEDQDSLEPPPALPAGVMHEDDGEISEKAAMDKTPVANGNGNGYHSEFEPVEMFVPPAADSTEKLEPEVVSGKPVAVGPPLSMSSPTATVSA